jgi:hypothetical protein
VGDVWYGPAVLTIRPDDRVKVTSIEKGTLVRVATGKLDVRQQLCEVRYRLWHLAEDRVVSETDELHRMRFFFPLELELALTGSGLALQSLTAFPHLDRPADETTWNALLVAR